MLSEQKANKEDLHVVIKKANGDIVQPVRFIDKNISYSTEGYHSKTLAVFSLEDFDTNKETLDSNVTYILINNIGEEKINVNFAELK